MTHACTSTDPQIWLADLFASQSAARGEVIRRKARDVERFAGWDAFRAEVKRRGFRAYENCGQVIIFCNAAPIQRIE